MHLVLARTPDAPEGVKGISLFVVPKFLVEADGSLGARNDVRCVSIEHKLGIHASPTAVLAFGDNEGAIGWLVGEENRGLETMFIMMNAARFSRRPRGRRAWPSAPTSARWPMRASAPRAVEIGGSVARQGRHHSPSRRAAHADADEVAHRGDACPGLRGRGGDGHRAAPCRRRANARTARPSST